MAVRGHASLRCPFEGDCRGIYCTVGRVVSSELLSRGKLRVQRSQCELGLHITWGVDEIDTQISQEAYCM